MAFPGPNSDVFRPFRCPRTVSAQKADTDWPPRPASYQRQLLNDRIGAAV
jgi:hypothetical protein